MTAFREICWVVGYAAGTMGLVGFVLRARLAGSASCVDSALKDRCKTLFVVHCTIAVNLEFRFTAVQPFLRSMKKNVFLGYCATIGTFQTGLGCTINVAVS